MSVATPGPLRDPPGCELSLSVAELEDALDAALAARCALLEADGVPPGMAAYAAEGWIMVHARAHCIRRSAERLRALKR